MSQLEGKNNNFGLLTADNDGALTVFGFIIRVHPFISSKSKKIMNFSQHGPTKTTEKPFYEAKLG